MPLTMALNKYTPFTQDFRLLSTKNGVRSKSNRQQLDGKTQKFRQHTLQKYHTYNYLDIIYFMKTLHTHNKQHVYFM